MPREIATTRTKSEGLASCDECGRRDLEWTRERARQHAHYQQHTVRFAVADVTVYTPTRHTRSTLAEDSAAHRAELARDGWQPSNHVEVDE